jgi:K+-sensing histidine kinase KdpD
MKNTVSSARILTLFFIIFIVIITFASFVYIDTVARNAIKESTRENLIGSASIIASQIDGDNINLLKPGDESTPIFVSLRDSLNIIRQSDPSIKYLYIMRRNSSTVEFVVDADYGTRPGGAPIGMIYPDPTEDLLNGFIRPSSEKEFTTDTWGATLSGFAPIYDSRGQVAGLVGVDMDRQDVMNRMEYVSTIFYAILIIILAILVAGAVIFDIRRTRVETMINRANQKLNLLNSVIRHDAINTLTALIGYEEMTEEIAKDPEVRHNLAIISGQTQKITKQIVFTRDYQNLGIKMPEWQEVGEVVRKAASELDMGSVKLSADFSDISINADPLLERVFHILLENSLEHGMTITCIRGYYKVTGHDLILYLEDDGVGIPEKDKDAIFHRKSYKNTGLGLFLVSEILSMTNITIRENGIPGEGAKFEISVPRHAFRLH